MIAFIVDETMMRNSELSIKAIEYYLKEICGTVKVIKIEEGGK